MTAKVVCLDRMSGQFAAHLIPARRNEQDAKGYVLPSLPFATKDPFALAEEGISAYVQNRVDDWLSNNRGAPAVAWFDPESPSIPARQPLSPARAEECRNALRSMKVLDRSLDEVQIQACVDGLESTVAVARSSRHRQDEYYGGSDIAPAGIPPAASCSRSPPTPTPPWTN